MKTTIQGFYGLFMAILMLLPLQNLQASAPQSIYLECPKNVTISCEEDISNLDKWGKVFIWENYVKRDGPKPKTVIYNTNSCGIGQIIRRWEYEDKHWKWHYCEQIITITGTGSSFGYSDIIWPKSTELEGCNPSADPKNLPREFSYPRFSNKKCSQPMYSYKDMKFTVADGCMKILRDWKVIDWCQYVPNAKPAVGLWTYTQVIKLVAKDSTAYIQCPKDTVVDAKLDCKGAYVKLDSAKAFSKCGAIHKIRNTSPYADTSGPDASGHYPLGTTKFYIIAEYGCGQEIKCQVSVTVRNKIGPTPYCLTGVIIALMPLDTNRDGQTDAGMVEVWAKDLDRGSFHKCGQKNLTFSFSNDPRDMNRIYTCDELGKNEVEIWVTDSSGNQSFCKTYIEVQNNNAKIPNCKRKDSLTTSPPQLLNISGLISFPNQQPMENVSLSLKDINSYQIQIRRDTSIRTKYDTIRAPSGTIYYIQKKDTVITIHQDTLHGALVMNTKSKNQGQFSFLNLTHQNSYQLIPEYDQKDLKGIDVNDAIILLRHLLKMEAITDPYKLLAADLNQDKIIDYADFNLLYGLVNGTVPLDQLKVLWRFVPKAHVFKSAQLSYQEDISSYMNFQKIGSSYDKADYYVIKLGDLDDNAGNIRSEISETRSDRTKTKTDHFTLFSVYPNPVSKNGHLYLDLFANESREMQFRLISLSGKEVYQKKLFIHKGQQIIELNQLPAQLDGLFLYHIQSGDQSHRGKLMITE
ncbi:MAG: T9SS type A sorting domain-containing protein [Saprospiraceae bacterium]|nr:T9SS type A sorting domain-containing protein [Saprospiraceae bacterium]